MRKIVGTLLLLVTLIGIIFPLALFGFSYTNLVRVISIQTSAMEPIIANGSLAISIRTPASEIRPGQIISSRTIDGTNGETLGRIQTIKMVKKSVYSYTLKSDANPLTDEWVYKSNTDMYKVVFSTPYVGEGITIFQSLTGSLIFITVILALAFIYIFRLHAPEPIQSKELRKTRRVETIANENAGFGGIQELSSWFDAAGNKK